MRTIMFMAMVACTGKPSMVPDDVEAKDTAEETDDPNAVDTDPPAGERYCQDADGDGFGAIGDCVVRTEQPAGFVADDHDCDDGNASVHPGAPELDEDIDEDCDGVYAEAFNECDANQWCMDSDGDGFGDPAHCVTEVEPTDGGYVDNDNDCNDLDGDVYPGASEGEADGADEDCDGVIDENYTYTVVCMQQLDPNLAAAELFVKTPLDDSMWPTCRNPGEEWPDCDISDRKTEIYGDDGAADQVPELLTYGGEAGWVCGAVHGEYGDPVRVGGLGLAGDQVRLVIDEDLDPIALVRVRIDGEEAMCTREARTFACVRPYRDDRVTRCEGE